MRSGAGLPRRGRGSRRGEPGPTTDRSSRCRAPKRRLGVGEPPTSRKGCDPARLSSHEASRPQISVGRAPFERRNPEVEGDAHLQTLGLESGAGRYARAGLRFERAVDERRQHRRIGDQVPGIPAQVGVEQRRQDAGKRVEARRRSGRVVGRRVLNPELPLRGRREQVARLYAELDPVASPVEPMPACVIIAAAPTFRLISEIAVPRRGPSPGAAGRWLRGP